MIHIIGGGPVGSHTAAILANAGHKVKIWEEHQQIGTPIQCTGIVTQEINKITKLNSKTIINRLNKVRVNCKNKSTSIKINDLVICRKQFDQNLASKAAQAGVELNLHHKFIGLKKQTLLIKDVKTNKLIKTKFEKEDYLIGADGPRSIVSQTMGNNPLEFWTGMQARIKTPVNKHEYQVWFGTLAPGFFGWSVPESETITRVGLAGKSQVYTNFKLLLAKFRKKQVIEMQGGLIPKFNSALRVQNKNLFLVGDAAGQVKATTGGGLVPGLQAGSCLAKSILTAKKYKSQLKPITNRLKKHLLIRKILDKFDDEDYKTLLSTINTKRAKSVLSKQNRDKNPAKLLLALAWANPRILTLAKVLFK